MTVGGILLAIAVYFGAAVAIGLLWGVVDGLRGVR